MRAALQDRLPEQLPDTHKHCMAAGLIARHCSLTEASLASVGKELKDLLGSGDAQWRDLQSDRYGLDCARGARNDDELLRCCMENRKL